MSRFPTRKSMPDFTEGNVTRQMLVFSAPLFASSLLQVVYNMADMVIVSHAAGKIGLSGVSVGGDVSNFLTFIAMGFSNAGQIIISQFIGAGRREKIGKFVGTLFSFLGLCAVALSVICLIFRSQILHLMNCPPESWDQALAYATVCMIGLVFIYGYNAVSAVLRGMGDSHHPFVFISIAAVMNIVLDMILVFGFGMGAFGAALATVISQGVSFLLCARFLLRNLDMFGIEIDRRHFFGLDRELLSTLVKLGIPMAIKSAAVMFSKLFVNSWINSYGVAVSAMAGIANKFGSISNLFSNSVNTAGSTMVGQNIGAQRYERVPRIMLVAATVTFIIATILSGAVYFFPNAVFGFFTKDPEVMVLAMEYIPIAILIFYGSCARASMNSLLNGSGNYRMNFAVAILDGMINRIGFALLFGLVMDMKYLGFWLGDAVAGFTPFVIGIVYYFSGAWKTRKYIIKEEQ